MSMISVGLFYVSKYTVFFDINKKRVDVLSTKNWQSLEKVKRQK